MLVTFLDGADSAVDDLKDMPLPVQRTLVELASKVLVKTLNANDDDEFALSAKAGYKVRRAVPRGFLPAQLIGDPRLAPLDDEQVCGCWFIYRDFNPAEILVHRGKDGFVVERIITSYTFADLLERHLLKRR